MKLSKKIRLLLNIFLCNKIIVASWGITNIQIHYHYLKFNVSGYLYQGEITIFTTATSSYNIHIGKKKINNCDIKNIINILDTEIERDSNYYDLLKKNLSQK